MLTVPEAAAQLGRSPETIRRWIRSGKLHARKIGTQHAIEEADLDAFMRGRLPAQAGEPALPYGDEPAWDEQPDELLARITINPALLGGKPAIKGTRISVELILENLAAGWTLKDILESYPHISEEDVRACLAYARTVIASETVVPIRPS